MEGRMAKARSTSKSEADSGVDLMTYSVRFTESERELLARAAALKSWSPTNLIRQSALEWAASIVNTSGQTSFKRLALKLAEQVARPKFYSVRVLSTEDDQVQAYNIRVSSTELADFESSPYLRNPYLQILGAEPEPAQLPPEEIAEINKAAKHGGVEFLRSFTEYNEGFAAPEKLDDTKIVTRPDSE